jgi:hypothetical protein
VAGIVQESVCWIKEGMVDWKNKDKLEEYIAFISYNIFLLCSYFYVGENSEVELSYFWTIYMAVFLDSRVVASI